MPQLNPSLALTLPYLSLPYLTLPCLVLFQMQGDLRGHKGFVWPLFAMPQINPSLALTLPYLTYLTLPCPVSDAGGPEGP